MKTLIPVLALLVCFSPPAEAGKKKNKRGAESTEQAPGPADATKAPPGEEGATRPGQEGWASSPECAELTGEERAACEKAAVRQADFAAKQAECEAMEEGDAKTACMQALQVHTQEKPPREEPAAEEPAPE